MSAPCRAVYQELDELGEPRGVWVAHTMARPRGGEAGSAEYAAASMDGEMAARRWGSAAGVIGGRLGSPASGVNGGR
jgi:hypothetical protein